MIGIIFVSLLCLQACSTETANLEKMTNQQTTNEKSNKQKERITQPSENISEISTLAFRDAENIEITDARKPQHSIEAIIHMDRKMKPETSAEQAFKQAYVFLQQDLKGANWVRFQVM